MNQPFDTKCAQLDDLLGVGRSFDMVSRELYVGGRRAKMWVVNGYAKDMLLERAVEKLQEVETLDGISGVDELLRRYITVCDAGTSRDRMQAVTDVFAGKTLLIIDGFSGGILLDAKTFPTRSVQEPDAGKVLRGSHDGFVESIMENAALLRRRIRDPALTLERIRLGGRSQCDVALCYMEGRADAKTLSQLREKLRRIDLRSVSMSQETIAEAIAPKQWYNPFPKVRYTERPDVAAASVLEPLTARKTCHGRLPLNVAVNAVVGTANATTLLSAIILVPVTVALAAVLPGNLVLPQGDVAMLLYLMIFVTAMSGGCLLRSLVTGLISAIVMLYSGTLLTYLFTAAAKAMDAATYGAGEFNTLCNTANPLSLLFVEGASFGIAGIAALAVLVLGLCFLAGRRLRRMTHRLAAQLAAAAAEETPTEEN